MLKESPDRLTCFLSAMKEKGFNMGVNASAKTSHTMHSSKTGCTSSAFQSMIKLETPLKAKSPGKQEEWEDKYALKSTNEKKSFMGLSDLTGCSSGEKMSGPSFTN